MVHELITYSDYYLCVTGQAENPNVVNLHPKCKDNMLL